MASTAMRCVWRYQSARNRQVLNIVRREMATEILEIDTPLIALAEAHRFIADCMEAVGTPKDFAKILADNLVEADYRGHYSHGMNRLDMYVKDVQGGLCDCKATPCILNESSATAWVNGNNGLGAVVGKYCMDLAIEKAKKNGVALVVAKESNHYGIAGMYALQAIKEGVIGMSFTNTSPLMAPTRAKNSALGTNPLSLGAPATDGDSFVLDMATTAVAVGKIEIQKRKKETIPEGWALDGEGKVTTDAAVGYDSRRLMPLGGSEDHSGYKGYGLGMLVEVFCGMLAGSAYGPNIRSWGDFSKKADLGHGFLAINPNCFAPGFEDRMSDLMSHIRNMEAVDPEKPVLVAGDPERLHMESVNQAGGLRYVQDQHDTCQKLAKELKVQPLQPHHYNPAPRKPSFHQELYESYRKFILQFLATIFVKVDSRGHYIHRLAMIDWLLGMSFTAPAVDSFVFGYGYLCCSSRENRNGCFKPTGRVKLILIITDTPVISLQECRRFIKDSMIAVGSSSSSAEALANILVEADYRGHYSHGMNRLEMYLSEIQNGICKTEAIPEILKESPATAWVDGHNGLGVVVGHFCMDIAIQKAKKVGVGWVVCKGSNHYGIAGMYSMQAMKNGLLGMSFTNTSPVVAPTRTKQVAIGTNPISLAAPGLKSDTFVLDMATSAVAVGKIEMKNRTNSPIPPQWAHLDTGALNPLGGNEANSSYKGYGLGLLVEIFCGILGGGSYGPNIRMLGDFSRMADLGHCFIAVDPSCFAPGFENRLTDLIESLRKMEPINPEKPVLVAGDPEKLHMKAVDEAGGVHRFIKDCLVAVGCPPANAESLATLLVEADYRGHYSHGINRLEMYLNHIRSGSCKPDAVPGIVKETVATAWVDGHNGLGVVVGHFCMDLAIQKAKKVGVGLVVCKGSNHYGIAAKYSLEAMKNGLLGMSFTNSVPLVAPTRTNQVAAIGTNPLSLAAPAANGDSFILDMATSAVAYGKVEMKKRTKSPIPSQWMHTETGALNPLGGDEINSSFKGYGLGVLVEILCGILGGGSYGPNIRKFDNTDKMADLGHCFIAIDPSCFAPGFEGRLTDLLESLRKLKPIKSDNPVLVPGDPEKLHMKTVDEAGGVTYVQDQLDTCNRVAQTLKKIKEGTFNKNAVPKVIKETLVKGLVDYNNGLLVYNFCMNLVIRKTQSCETASDLLVPIRWLSLHQICIGRVFAWICLHLQCLWERENN
ncbi:uncharacterized protein BDFB_003152 [Asbolus verrucosus]|uniref:Malate dehydrogenase n=1 Tax=Asbolus verrucosus TaxID=1661398 RepID=A0A482VS32_ASBVE|nr:uncharacterized protein BDFB_003152 [Asbolus verrucosus]